MPTTGIDFTDARYCEGCALATLARRGDLDSSFRGARPAEPGISPPIILEIPGSRVSLAPRNDCGLNRAAPSSGKSG